MKELLSKEHYCYKIYTSSMRWEVKTLLLLQKLFKKKALDYVFNIYIY